jgi:phosphatidylserine/phosphatidylglycerophosphate/cardiolipin synthase-like enzyme
VTNTDPQTWFLPEEQTPRVPAFTSDNDVTALVDGQAYMSHLAARLAGQGSEDYLHFAGWRVTGSLSLEPDVLGSPAFFDVLADLLARGVTLRALVWLAGPGGSGSGSGSGGVTPSSQMMENVDFVDKANAFGATAVLDNRTVLTSSHHQKAAVLSSDGQDWAYVGGIDIAPDRWDGPAHDQPVGRTREAFDAWHDIHCALRGPAVADVWQNFTDRWNDPTPANSLPGMPGPVTPPPITASPPAPLSIGTHHVQILRTLSCGVYPFQVGGEQTVRLAYERAVDAAEHYIYIEDQYLWPCPGDFAGGSGLVTKLHDATVRGVKVVCVVAHRNDLALTAPYHNQMQQDVLDFLRSDRPDNVFVFDLQQPDQSSDIYVHSKLLLVDDCLAVIGSPNIGRRSQTSDSELAVAVVDADIVPGTMDGAAVSVCRFAKDLRLTLWMEHLALPDPSGIDDPIAGLAAWPDQSTSTPTAPNSVHHAVCHFVGPERPSAFLPDLRPLMNLETICP